MSAIPMGQSLDAVPAPPAHDAAASPEHPDAALAGRLLARGFPWMRFPAGLEQAFQQHGAAQRLRHLLVSGALSMLVFNGFLVADWLVAPDVLQEAVKVRLGLFTPLFLLVLGFAALCFQWVIRQLPMWFIEGVVLMSSLCAAAAVAYILSITQSDGRVFYHAGFLVVLAYSNVVQRQRFWYAVASSAAVMAMHLWCAHYIAAPEPRLLPPLMTVLLATAFFTLVANYALERDERRQFLLSLRRRHLLQELDGVHAKLQRISRVDGLTGVFNRHHAQETLEHAWRRAAHDGSTMAVILVDVDHFKKYNDHHGHQAGDLCLQQVAQALSQSLRRPTDLVARYGGEEFIALLPQADAAQATQAAERMRQAVEQLGLAHEASDTAPVVTVSVGVAMSKATPTRDSAALVEAADQALYHAKHRGRNRVATQHLG